jgi:HD-like signal output (HDOD) protein
MTVSAFFRSVLSRAKASSSDFVETPLPSAALTDTDPFSSNRVSNDFHKFLFGGNSREPLSTDQKAMIKVAVDNLSKKEYRVYAVPRLPTVIPKLIRSLRDPKCSVRDYVAIINKDPAMSAAVLKLANSAYFNVSGTYTGDIEKAIALLGIAGLRSVLSAAVMQPIIQRESPYFSQIGKQLWIHSLNTAVACEVTAAGRQLDRFQAYLLGLTHDIGKITLFSELCKVYKFHGITKPGVRAFIPALQTYSAQLSGHIAKDWLLPEDVQQALFDQTNIACEIFAYTPQEDLPNVFPILELLDLPENFFTYLTDLGTDIG